mmetsp:Transcript_65119/g.212191  ORF Transcript_65119/g.212191 Transcript_65119/m.212191 type:complete len:223 (+) Transcript_65119:297-965(+)
MFLSTLASCTPPKPPELSRTRDPIFENEPWAASSDVAPPSKFSGGCNSEVIAVDKDSAYTSTVSAAPRPPRCSRSSSCSSSSAVFTINNLGATAKHDLKNSKKVKKNKKKDEKAEQESSLCRRARSPWSMPRSRPWCSLPAHTLPVRSQAGLIGTLAQRNASPPRSPTATAPSMVLFACMKLGSMLDLLWRSACFLSLCPWLLRAFLSRPSRLDCPSSLWQR